MSTAKQSCNLAGDCEAVFSYPMLRDLERVQEPFTAIAAHHMVEANLAIRTARLARRSNDSAAKRMKTNVSRMNL